VWLTDSVSFTGTTEPGVPWMFWTRIRPDADTIDLPPKFRIERIDEEDPS